MNDSRKASSVKPRSSVRRLWRFAGLSDHGSVGLVPAVLIVALALALMLWALPGQDIDAQSTLQAPTLSSHLISMANH